jgi:hypothetical protein
MRKFIGLLMILSFTLALSGPTLAQPDHGVSDALGAEAALAGQSFVKGARKIAVPFIVVGKTVIDGAAFVILKGEQGIIYVTEEVVFGLEYVVKGAKFVIIKTAQGIRWVAVEALKAAEIIFTAVLDVAELVIEDVVYVLIKLEDGVAFVAKKLVQAGRLVIKGVKYIVQKTADGIVWVTEQTWNAIRKGAAFAREKYIVVDIRARLSTGLMAGPGCHPADLEFFQNVSIDQNNSVGLRKLAGAAYAAAKAFTETYAPSNVQK